jgi:YVTN family beta-propeller protein
MSVAGDDKVEVIDYATESVVAEIAVGKHPQRIRLGAVASDIAAQW